MNRIKGKKIVKVSPCGMKSSSLELAASLYSQNHSMSIVPKPETGLRTKLRSSLTLKTLKNNSSYISPKSLKSQVQSSEALERKLTQKLIRSSTEDYISIYSSCFEEVIKIHPNLCSLLKKIKAGYENHIEILTTGNFKELLSRIAQLKAKIIETDKEKKHFLKQIEKYKKENTEISRNLDMTESLYIQVQEKLQKVYNVKLEDNKEYNLKYVMAENKRLDKACKRLEKEVEELTAREKQLISIVVELEERGFPVKKVYNDLQNFEKVQREEVSDRETDSEMLVSGKTKDVERPVGVPLLELDMISFGSSSEDITST